MEKAGGMILGMLAGADTFGHCGICGTDHAASLEWLYADNELAAYAKRIVRGFSVGSDTLATEVVRAVGPGGNFLAEEHTVGHFREEMWLAGPAWTRQSWDDWDSSAAKSMGDRIREQVTQTLSRHEPIPLAPALAEEVDAIVDAARRELGSTKETGT
jgi:trimethylamine--corrinoid protein Co-methyltransferase